MRRTLIISLAVLVFSAVDGKVCGGAEAPANGWWPAPEKGPSLIEETLTDFGEEVEETHDRIERDILEQAIRFDDFFGTARMGKPRQTVYELRWRNSLRIEQDGHLHPGTSVRASVVLSKISDRLHLAISGEKEPEPFPPALPQDPGNPGFDRTLPTARIVNTELRYGLIGTPAVDWFLGAGVRIALPFEVFVRTRYQYTHRISDSSLARIAVTPFVKNTDWLGETTEVSLERMLDGKTLLLWASSATASEEISGIEWGSEISLTHRLSEKSAVTLTGGAYGNSNSPAIADSYRVLARYRRNFLKRWLYYELEPEVSWPRTPQGTYNPTFAFTGRIEIVFQGSVNGDRKLFSSSETPLPPGVSRDLPD